MYLHIGTDTIIRTEDIIAILDLDSCTITHRGREYLTASERKGTVINVAIDALPKTYIVTEHQGKTIIYVSPISSSTIAKRIHNGWITVEEEG